MSSAKQGFAARDRNAQREAGMSTAKQRLLALTSATYTGIAERLAK